MDKQSISTKVFDFLYFKTIIIKCSTCAHVHAIRNAYSRRAYCKVLNMETTVVFRSVASNGYGGIMARLTENGK